MKFVMIDISNLKEELINSDGSCREINLGEINRDRACSLIGHLCDIYDLDSATAADGEDVTKELSDKVSRKKLLHKGGEFINCSFQNDRHIIKRIQAYFGRTEDDRMYVELTFFPEDVNSKFHISAFQEFMNTLLIFASVDHYYVRHENASWVYGDTSPDSGVIYVGSLKTVH